MRAVLVILMLVICLPGVARAADNKLPPVNYDQDTLSLPPAYFPEMPGAIRAWLEEREYRIPQVHEWRIKTFWDGCFLKLDKYNVSGGDFNGVGQQDWVIVTFRDDTLRSYICWDSDTVTVEQLDISEFGLHGYTWGYAFSRDVTSFDMVLAKVNQDWLNSPSISAPRKVQGDEKELPATFDHDGFVFQSDGDMWDGGYVRYYHNGDWIRFYHFGVAIATTDTLCLQEKYGSRH